MQLRVLPLEETKDTTAVSKIHEPRHSPQRLLKLFVLFVALCIPFSVISIYTIRHFGVERVVNTVQSTFQPCYEGINNLESWIRPPSNLIHNMNDKELLWRASFVPRVNEYPFHRTPKMAFMFLTKGPLPLAPLWESFFKGHEGLYSIYVHSLPSFQAHFPSSSVFYRKQIPSQVSEWGKMSMCDAERRLLANALLDISNESGKSSHRKNRVENTGKLKHLIKHVRKSIQSEDGDLIDCIDVLKQSAFNHPALKSHIIQMAPSYDPNVNKMGTSKAKSPKKRNDEPYVTLTSQLWKKSGSCPKGTIPMRRIREKKLLNLNLTEDYGRKLPSFVHQVAQLNGSDNSYFQHINHSKAVLLTQGNRYTGAKGDIKVWNPFVEADDEYSTSRVFLQNGPHYKYESIESGWVNFQVNPSVYGDRQTRLYVYWTVDSSNKTGCFDLTCPGFVQTSHEIALGAAIYPISVRNGLPYQITIYIFKDPSTSNWWVQYGESINLGYWPPELFTSLSDMARVVEWGGEVYSTRLQNPDHTATAMGNGKFPDYVFQDSGCIRRMRIRDNDPTLKFPDWVYGYTDEYRCYDVTYIGDYIEDPEFYYGGPGRSYMCP